MKSILVKKGKEKDFNPLFGSIAELLDHHGNEFGDREALITVEVDKGEKRKISYEEFAQLVYKAANFLHGKGITKGDRIAFALHNSAAILILEFAAGLLGASSAPLDIRRDTKERKAFKLTDGGIKILFIGTPEEDVQKEIRQISEDMPDLQTLYFAEDKGFFDLIAKEPSTPLFSLIDSLEEEYVLLYTSGTTANPKGVPLTLKACFTNARGIVEWQHLSAKDRFLIVLPLHHVNSTIMSLATILAGGTVILSSRYSASKFWVASSKYEVTITSIVPTILHDLLARKEEYLPKHYDMSSFKRICIGSAPVLPAETLRFMETFGIQVVQGYGQTETALRVTGVPVELPKEIQLEMTKNNSIGTELAYCNVTILREDGTDAEEGEEGEICIRGPVLAQGYWNNEEETKKAFGEGWYHSGDLGSYQMLHGEKYFFIKGRIKEIIIKGGINLSPVAVEDALLKSFSEIDEVCVVGYADTRMGEDVAAVVSLKEDVAENKRDEIADRIVQYGSLDKIAGVSRYEAPSKVFVAKKELPKTSTGKIQRLKVKEMVAEWLQGEAMPHYYCRLIGADEKKVLARATEVNNKRWHVKADVSEFEERAKNGYVIGVFNENEELQGTLSALQIAKSKLEKVLTWDEVTGKGTLNTHDPKGKVMLCVAISVESEGNTCPVVPEVSAQLVERVVGEYVQTNLDNVIRFHRKAKGGMSEGAEVTKILPKGRPEDEYALGYNILMEYPEISEKRKIIKSKNVPPSIMLIEQAMILGKDLPAGRQEKAPLRVVAFSRPAQLKLHIAKALDDSVTFEPKNKEEFAKFATLVKERQ